MDVLSLHNDGGVRVVGLRFPCSRDVWAVVRWVRYSDCPEAAQLGGDWIDRF